MIKIMFVCHGNICRSPMAEYMFKDMLKKENREQDFIVESSATSYEEIGNPVHYGTKRILQSLGIDCSEKRSKKLTVNDYDRFDFFIGMDERNRVNVTRMFGGDKDNKISCLMDYTERRRDVADPYYTGDFQATYQDVKEGLIAFYKFIKNYRRV